MKVMKDGRVIAQVSDLQNFLKEANLSRDEVRVLYEPHEAEQLASGYIYTHYPQTKQNSDLADKLYYENLLKAAGVQNLEADIVAKVQSFYDGKSLEEVLADVDENHKEAYEQLTKVGIRVAWVQPVSYTHLTLPTKA